MKSTFKYIALVLLYAMATSATYADNYKGTMTRLGTKMEYSFTGGVVTNKQLKGQGTTDMIVFVDGQVEAGSTVSAKFKKLVDYRKKAQDVRVEMWVETTNGKKQVQDKKGKDAATASFMVPDNAKKVEVKMTYTGRMGRFHCFIDWDVVKKGSTKPGNNQGQTIIEEEDWYGVKIKYSISGGKLISKGNSALGDNDYYLEASPGSTITLSSTLLSKPEDKYSKYYTHVGFSGCGSELNKDDPTSATISFTIPKNADMTSVLFGSIGLYCESGGHKSHLASKSMRCSIVAKKGNNNNNPTPNKSFNWDDVAGDDQCHHCHGQFSNYFFHIPQGGPAVTICNNDTKKTNKKIVDGLSVLYYQDWIITGDDESELVLDHCDNDGVMKILGKTKVLLRKHENGIDYWGLYNGRILGRHVKHDNVPNPFFNMTNCTVQPNGAIYMLVDDHKTSRVFLFKGSIEVKCKTLIFTLKPGQVGTVDEDGQAKLQKFDLDAAAKKYKVKLSK